MRPYHCITRHNPPDTYGDCLRACVATILDIPPKEIPNFALGDLEMFKRLAEWLAPLGYAPFFVRFPVDITMDEIFESMKIDNPSAVYILIGSTENDQNHTVVCKGDHIAWNPAWAGCRIIAPPVMSYGEPCWLIIVLGKV